MCMPRLTFLYCFFRFAAFLQSARLLFTVGVLLNIYLAFLKGHQEFRTIGSLFYFLDGRVFLYQF